MVPVVVMENSQLMRMLSENLTMAQFHMEEDGAQAAMVDRGHSRPWCIVGNVVLRWVGAVRPDGTVALLDMVGIPRRDAQQARRPLGFVRTEHGDAVKEETLLLVRVSHRLASLVVG